MLMKKKEMRSTTGSQTTPQDFLVEEGTITEESGNTLALHIMSRGKGGKDIEV
jgi:hypothetical protein